MLRVEIILLKLNCCIFVHYFTLQKKKEKQIYFICLCDIGSLRFPLHRSCLRYKLKDRYRCL